jgi:methyltransferase (TIGR00027 family)
MKHERMSSTAEATAAMRAAHFLYHQPVIFNDPYALQLTSPALRRVCQNRFYGWLLRRKFISESHRPITAQVVSRAKYAEEKLEQAGSKGISQYVIISAGLDSFCVRRPDFSAGLQIYEIDHPATQ